MVSLKTSVAFLLVAVACVSAGTVTKTDTADDKTKNDIKKTVEIDPEPLPLNTTILPPSSTNPVPPDPTTSTTTTTTKPPPITTTTTVAPNPTTVTPNSTTVTPTTLKPTTTTVHPEPSTTTSPNVTTTIPPSPAPQPPPRNWDGSSFLSGMVLAFGIVAVGFVGYRFFYLGRGGAYHTL